MADLGSVSMPNTFRMLQCELPRRKIDNEITDCHTVTASTDHFWGIQPFSKCFYTKISKKLAAYITSAFFVLWSFVIAQEMYIGISYFTVKFSILNY